MTRQSGLVRCSSCMQSLVQPGHTCSWCVRVAKLKDKKRSASPNQATASQTRTQRFSDAQIARSNLDPIRVPKTA